jgi:hypothetical protein
MDDDNVSFFAMAEHDLCENGSLANHIAFQLMFSSLSVFQEDFRQCLLALLFLTQGLQFSEATISCKAWNNEMIN